jgi:hypothetical protein
LYKGESIAIEVYGHQYFAHSTNINYWIGQHDISGMEYTVVDSGANRGVCGDDMLVVEGSKQFVDVSGLAGHKVNQLRIVTAQALVTTHKGDAIATFNQMAFLVKAKAYCLAFRWKLMVPTLMIDHAHNLELNNLFSLMDNNIH